MRTSRKTIRLCCICAKPIPPHGIWVLGHNAQPVKDGRCCSVCNNVVVIPERLAIMRERQS
jgi:hypothetical protein